MEKDVDIEKEIEKLVSEHLTSSLDDYSSTIYSSTVSGSNISSGGVSIGPVTSVGSVVPSIYGGGATYGTGYVTTGTTTINIPSSTWGGTFTIPAPNPNAPIITYTNNSKEIVRLEKDGKVVWNGDIEIDEAAEAFAKSMTLGAEMAAGITRKVKLAMRDSVFEDLIEIAKEKGSLTAEDLHYLLQASKIVEKLKGKE